MGASDDSKRGSRSGEFETVVSDESELLQRIREYDEERVPVLVVLHGEEIGRRYLINQDVLVIGRRPDRADLVVLGDRRVSSRHVRLERIGDHFQLSDLGSLNGTTVNGRRIADAWKLLDGDRILVGNTVLKFTYQDELEEHFHVHVERMMNIDDLTGLVVKRSFDQRCDWAIDAARRETRSMTVLMMDMDGLKRINDTHGHQVGAETIARVGMLLGEIVNPRGCVTRFGGDEFTAFLSPCARHEGLDLAETIRAAVEVERIEVEGVRARPTISIGLSTFPEDGTTRAELVRKADAALYRAKGKGRNCVSE